MHYEAIKQLIGNPFTNIVLFLAASVLAIYLYYKSKAHPKISYDCKEVSLIGSYQANFARDLEVIFQGKKVNRITITQFVIWNSGNTTINQDQLVDKDHFRIDLQSNNQILKTQILKTTRDVNSANIAIASEKSAEIDFIFLDPGDGFTIEITHAGKLGELKVAGTIKGMPLGIKKYESSELLDRFIDKLPFPSELVKSFTFIVLAIIMIASLTIYEIYYGSGTYLQKSPDKNDSALSIVLAILSGLAGMLAGFLTTHRKKRPYPAKLHSDIGKS